MRNALFYILMMFLLVAAEIADAGTIYIMREPASITRAATALGDASNIFEKGTILSPELIQTYNFVKEQNKQNPVENPIADQAELFRGKDANQASLLVADKYTQYWWNHSDAKYSSLGRRVDFVESGMQKQMVLQSGELSHKFDFSIQTFSTVAKLEYSGFFKAAVSYQANDSSTQVEMSEKVWDQKNLVLTYSNTKIEDRSAINLRWSW